MSRPFKDLEYGEDEFSRPSTSESPDFEIGSSYSQQSKELKAYARNPTLAKVQRFLEGPSPPRDEPPRFTNPLLVPLEQFPQKIAHQYPQRLRLIALISYFSVSFLIVYTVMHPHLIGGPQLKGSKEEIVSLSCTGDGHFWDGKNQQCGPNGEWCMPLKSEVIIKCPALCDRGWVYSALPVGDDMIKYRQFAIGGGTKEGSSDTSLTYPYRGDSSPCSSAVHGGALSPYFGGCVKLVFTGEKWSFESRSGPHGTGWSVSFPSFFPSSFVFGKLPSGLSGCHDPRLIVMVLNVIFGLPVIYLASGSIGYWTSSLVAFWTIVLVLDPPYIVNPQRAESTAELVSNGFAKMLPTCFVLYTLWSTSVKRTIGHGSSPLAKTFLWYSTFWVGAANIITFDRFPIDRLTPEDIKQMPGSFMAVIIVIPLIVVCVVLQAFQIWRAGRFPMYLKFYISMIVGVFVLAMLPNLELRIHHYILGMMLLPGTATKGITAYALQGLLLGLMLSGIARWDFASIVETHVSLLRGEAGASSAPPANLTYTGGVLNWVTEIEEDMIPDEDLTGFSLMVNDVETYIGNDSFVNLGALIDDNEYLRASIDKATYDSKDVDLFFRVAMSSTRDGSFIEVITPALESSNGQVGTGPLHQMESVKSCP